MAEHFGGAPKKSSDDDDDMAQHFGEAASGTEPKRLSRLEQARTRGGTRRKKKRQNYKMTMKK